MDKILIRDATLDDARHVGAKLRAGDYFELLATEPGIRPAIMVIESFKISEYCKACIIDDKPAILFGVASVEGSTDGVVWMLSTPAIMHRSRQFMRQCKDEVHKMQLKYPYLYNHIHQFNDVSKNWLTWLGFTISDEVDPSGFQFFSRSFNDV